MTNEKLSLVVLAAGLGSRYGGLKQMDPMGPGGEIILDYSVYDALRAGFDRVVFVISKAIEDIFRERIGNTIEKFTEVAYVFQSVDDVPAGFHICGAERALKGDVRAQSCPVFDGRGAANDLAVRRGETSSETHRYAFNRLPALGVRDNVSHWR